MEEGVYVECHIKDSCTIQCVLQSDGFISKRNGLKIRCGWGPDDNTQCLNGAEVEIHICSGFHVVRYCCRGCLDLVLIHLGTTTDQLKTIKVVYQLTERSDVS